MIDTYDGYKELGVAIIERALIDYRKDYERYLRKGIRKPERDRLINNRWLQYLMELCGIHIPIEKMVIAIEERVENEIN